MTAQAAVARGRAKAESLMIDTCTVHRPSDPVTDPETGIVTRPMSLIYDGKCKFQQTLAQARGVVSGEHEFSVQDARWDTPVGVGPFEVGDVVTGTAAPLDPDIVGTTYKVSELFNKSFATAQRCRVEEVTA